MDDINHVVHALIDLRDFLRQVALLAALRRIKDRKSPTSSMFPFGVRFSTDDRLALA
jgi:hypothetical protein